MLELNSLLQKRYRIIRQLGQGGMGTVYEAIDQRVKCSVVLKRTLFKTDEMRQAFEREARLLANLRHGALPKVMDHFIERDEQFLVMEFIPGNDLDKLLKMLGRPFPPIDVLRWGDELLRVLEYLHNFNPPILHRDIKPSNLKLTEDGEIFLLDFGLAKGAAGQMTTIGPAARSVSGYTPNYAPLEQILRSDLQNPDRPWIETLSSVNQEQVDQILKTPTDVRSDLYSLGVTLYHLITGEPPTSAVKRARYVWKGQPDPLFPAKEVNPLIPDEVSNVIQSAVELSPDQRLPDAATMRLVLREAGQSLRQHTGQVGLQQLSKEAIDVVAQRAIEQLMNEIKPYISALSRDQKVLQQELTEHLVIIQTERMKLESQRSEIGEIDKSIVDIENELLGVGKNLEELKRETNLENLPPETIDSIARRAVEQLSEKIIQEIAWEVVPQLAQRLIEGQLQQDRSATEVAAKGAQLPQELKNPSLTSPPNLSTLPDEERRIHNDAIRFARLLVSEIKIYNEQKIKAALAQGNIYESLREDIEISRRMYEKRVAPPVVARYDYFHHELVKTLAKGDLSKMGAGYPGFVLKKEGF